METKRVPLAESMLFLTVVTFMGGFLDTYIYTVRSGFFPNGHTTNMAKVGIALAQGNWSTMFLTLLFPLSCTGNLRSMAQFFFSALQDKTASSWMRFLKYGSFLVTFILGSAASFLLCGVMDKYASLVGAAIVAGLYAAMVMDDKKNAAEAKGVLS